MRQEIDGPQAEQLEFVPPCGQIVQDEDNSRRIIGEAGSCPDKRDHVFLIVEVKETFLTVQKCSLEVKKGVMSTYP